MRLQGREQLQARVASYPYWYQRIDLGQGILTTNGPLYHEIIWDHIKPAFPSDLQHASILDVGCNAGYFAIRAKQLNAGKVVGIEPHPMYLEQAELCRDALGLDIEYRQMDAHEVGSLNESFDITIFTGILYHLKAPLLVLESLGRICRDAIVVETECIIEDPTNSAYVRQGPLGAPVPAYCRSGIMKFIEGDELNGDGSNWWVPDTACVLGMLRTAGFCHFSAPRYLIGGSRVILVASKSRSSHLDLAAL